MLPFTPPIGKLQFILYNSKCQKTEMLYFPNDSAESTELLEILFLNKRGTRVYFEKNNVKRLVNRPVQCSYFYLFC